MATPPSSSSLPKDWLGIAATAASTLDLDSFVSAPRRAGKSSFGEAIKDFLATPGYSSSEAAKFESHDAYMEHLTGKFEVADTPTHNIAEIQRIISDPGNSWQFMLNQPQSLTVMRGGQYRKDSFIGGELLRLKGVYEGKRDGLIARFEEDRAGLVTSPAGTIIEIPFSKAETLLDGFKDFLSYVENPPADPAKVAEETKKVAEKRLEENPIYGSW